MAEAQDILSLFQRVIEEKAWEHGVSVVYVDPGNTSRPIHYTEPKYATLRE